MGIERRGIKAGAYCPKQSRGCVVFERPPGVPFQKIKDSIWNGPRAGVLFYLTPGPAYREDADPLLNPAVLAKRQVRGVQPGAIAGRRAPLVE